MEISSSDLISSCWGILFYVTCILAKRVSFPNQSVDFLYYSLSLLFATVAGFAVHLSIGSLIAGELENCFFPRF